MLYACFCLNHFLLIIRKLDKIMILTFWICTALLFWYLFHTSGGGSLGFAGGAWISIVVMVIIAIIISFIFGISLEN